MTESNLHQINETNGQHAGTVQSFRIDGKLVRVVIIDGAPWFVARDICRVMDITWSGATLRFLEGDESRCYPITTNGVTRKMTLVSEGAMYQLVFRGTTAGAKKFTRWVTREVLPEIRAKGYYARPGALSDGLVPQLIEGLRENKTSLLVLSEHLARVEAHQARMAIALLPSVPPRTLRAELDALVEDVARAKRCHQGTVMIALYREVQRRHHIDYISRKKGLSRRRGRRMAVLDVVEKDGNLRAIYDLAMVYYPDLLEKRLPTETTPQAEFAAADDPLTAEELEDLETTRVMQWFVDNYPDLNPNPDSDPELH